MPSVECGFTEGPESKRSLDLLHYGPTLPVQVGFDETFRVDKFQHPELPGDPILAVVDTGATRSCIDTSLIASLDLPPVGRQTFGGITGPSEHTMHLAQIYIPVLEATIYGQFAAVDLVEGGQGHKVLLGRSFLQRFRMIYDERNGGVIIENDSQPND